MKLIESDAVDDALLVDQLLVLEELALARARRARCSASSVFQSRCFRRGVSPSSGSMTSESAACSGSRSSRAFQTSASPPPGRSTRWISRSASSASNQWNACADRDRVDAAVGERDPLGGAGERGDRRHAPLELGAHLAHRLDRDRRSRRSGRAGASACPSRRRGRARCGPAAGRASRRCARPPPRDSPAVRARTRRLRRSRALPDGAQTRSRDHDGRDHRKAHGARRRRALRTSLERRCPAAREPQQRRRSRTTPARRRRPHRSRSTCGKTRSSTRREERRREHVLDLPVVAGARSAAAARSTASIALHQRVVVVVTRSRAARSRRPAAARGASRRTRPLMSNQWNAWATVTASTEPSGSGIASALPACDLDLRQHALEARARISSPGSTATTSAPSATSCRVSFPVPAPRSSTRPNGSRSRDPRDRVAARTAAATARRRRRPSRSCSR